MDTNFDFDALPDGLYPRTVRPEDAAGVLRRYPFDDQRKTKDGRVDGLLDIMRRGKWLVSTASLYRTPGGRPQTVNGYGRLTAMSRQGESHRLDFHLATFALQSEIDALYQIFDTKESVRTVRDLSDCVDELKTSGLTMTQKTDLTSAVGFINDGFLVRPVKNGPALSTGDKVQAAADWVETMQIVDELVRNTKKQHAYQVQRMAPLAVMLVTLRHQEAMARGFWAKVLTGAEPGDDPTRLLHLRLLDWWRVPRGRDSKGQSIRPPDYNARLAAHAWNRYFIGERATHLKVMFPRTPIDIAGTPWKKVRILRPGADNPHDE